MKEMPKLRAELDLGYDRIALKLDGVYIGMIGTFGEFYRFSPVVDRADLPVLDRMTEEELVLALRDHDLDLNRAELCDYIGDNLIQ